MENRFLFRGKRIDNSEWIQGYLYGIWERRYILWGMSNDIPNMVEVDPSTICQCTGLQDKNGELIWENDIVIVPSDEEPCLLEWEDGDGCWSMKQDGTVYTFDNFWSNEVEVIGNTFDNPELLEVGE